jgi:large conductance mechanosensitive channel
MNIKEIGNEFRAFVLKGNVVDLATGVIIGAAFGKIVSAFTEGIVLPLLNKIGGNPEVSLRLWVFDLGLIITNVLQFIITAAVIFFLVVKPMNTLIAMTMKKAEEKPAEPPPIPEDVKLLIEIRDLLKSQGGKPVA